MAFELWETSSRNLIGDFPTENSALEAVRRAVETHGQQYVETWLLAIEDEHGETNQVAAGDGLVRLARRTRA